MHIKYIHHFDLSRKCITKPYLSQQNYDNANPDNNIHMPNMGPTWILSAPDGPHAGPMNLAIGELPLYPLVHIDIGI